MDALPKILYVDDEVLNLQLFKMNFKKKYDLETAESGYDGLKILASSPDIKTVISDMRMPGMSGVEFITQAREQFADLQCFILTAFEISHEIQAAIDSGKVKRYFRKPFSFKEMDAALVEVLEDQGQRG